MENISKEELKNNIQKITESNQNVSITIKIKTNPEKDNLKKQEQVND